MKWLFLAMIVAGGLMLVFGTTGEQAYEDGTALLVLILLLLGGLLVLSGGLGLGALLFAAL